MAFQIAVLPLPRRVVSKAEKIDGAFGDEFLDNLECMRKGHLKARMHAVIDLQHVAHCLQPAQHRLGVVVAADVAIGGPGMKADRGIGGGHPSHGKATVKVAQPQFHRHAHIGAWFHLALDHVAVHVDEPGQQHQPLPLQRRARHRHIGNFGDQAAFDAHRTLRQHPVSQHHLKVRQPHRTPSFRSA